MYAIHLNIKQKICAIMVNAIFQVLLCPADLYMQCTLQPTLCNIALLTTYVLLHAYTHVHARICRVKTVNISSKLNVTMFGSAQNHQILNLHRT